MGRIGRNGTFKGDTICNINTVCVGQYSDNWYIYVTKKKKE